MCGRYQRRADKQKIAEAFQLGNVDGLALEFTPDYNAAPQSMQPVIVWDEAGGMRVLQMMFWRFLPPFVTDPKKFRLDTINAKGETLLDSRMWRSAFLHSRCLIPVDSFIEWKRVDAKTKLPWIFAMRNDGPFALGGVWQHWRSPDGKTEMDTFAVITTEPNELLVEKTGHDRMPVIIKRSDYQRWLEPGNEEQPPVDLIRPFDSDKMKAWRVDRRINNVRNNEPSLSEHVKDNGEERKDGSKTEESGQLGMFD
jgi:putative SOS response-associated peptidase YedK